MIVKDFLIHDLHIERFIFTGIDLICIAVFDDNTLNFGLESYIK